MLLKWLGSVIILVSSTLIGYKLAEQVKERVVLLQDFKTSILMLQTEIQFTLTPLAEAFENISSNMHGKIKEFFLNISEEMNERSGRTVDEIIHQGIQKIFAQAKLKKEDLEPILQLSKSIGGSDVEGQVRAIQLCIEYLEQRIRQASSEREKSERMYQTLGVLSGISIVIVLI